MLAQRSTKPWFLLFAAVLVTCSISISLSAATEAAAPRLQVQVCRAYVEPCQSQVSIPSGGAVDLNLVLSPTDQNQENEPTQIAAWETHFQLGDGPNAALAVDTASNPSVQERGDPELALDSLAQLLANSDEEPGQFFTAQNLFDPNSGKLDYTVTLVRFDQSKSQPRVLPLLSEGQLYLGRTSLEGLSDGSVDITPQDLQGNPFQVVAIDSSGRLISLDVAPSSTPLANIKVGGVMTPEVRGQIVLTGPSNGPLSGRSPMVLAVSFWQTGAVPAWRGGNDLPVATFRRVVTDAAGSFNITDISPSLLPSGAYDLRVTSSLTLSTLVRGVTVPAPTGSPGPPPVASISVARLRDGDIDGNNTIDAADLQALKASFGHLESESAFNANGDFNGDGVVDVVDFVRLAENFGKSGD